MIDVAVIIVSWNVRDYLANCLRSVCAELHGRNLTGQIWVVDNNSTDGSAELLSDLFPHVKVIRNTHNPGFGAANNQGIVAAAVDDPRYYFLLNPDTLVRPSAIATLVSHLDANPKVGVAGARLLYGDGRFQHSAFAFPGIRQLLFELLPMPDRLYETRLNGRYPRRYFEPDVTPFSVDHPLGATMMIRAEVADTTGGFDESFHMYCEEIDWSWRIRQAGWEIHAVPQAEIIHYGGESTSQIQALSLVNLWRSRAQLYHKHYSPWKADMATRLVRWGMARKAAETHDPELKNAYHEIIRIWSNGSQ